MTQTPGQLPKRPKFDRDACLDPNSGFYDRIEAKINACYAVATKIYRQQGGTETNMQDSTNIKDLAILVYENTRVIDQTVEVRLEQYGAPFSIDAGLSDGAGNPFRASLELGKLNIGTTRLQPIHIEADITND